MSLVPKFYKYSCHIESETTSSTLSFSRKLKSFRSYVLTPCIQGGPVFHSCSGETSPISIRKQSDITLQKIAYLH